MSLRFQKEIICDRDWLLVIVAMPRAVCVFLTCYSSEYIISASYDLVRFIRTFFHQAFVCSKISCSIAISSSQFLVILSIHQRSIVLHMNVGQHSIARCYHRIQAHLVLCMFYHVDPRFYVICWNYQALKVVP